MEKYIGLLLKAACYDDDKNSLVVLAQHAKEGPNHRTEPGLLPEEGERGARKTSGEQGGNSASWARESGRERRQISSNSTAGHYEKGGSNVDKKRVLEGGRWDGTEH